MADKTFDDLYNHILPYLPGAEAGIVDFHIRRTLREFFKRTTVWREVFAFNTDDVGTANYQLQPTSGQVSSILSVYLDGRPIGSVPEHLRDRMATAGRPCGWYSLLPQLITLYPAPDGVYAVSVEAAITLPIDVAVREFPEGVFDTHAESIAAGVIAGMMMMPGKPWTQREAAKDYSRVFGSALRDLRGRLRDGGQPNVSTFTGPRFGK